jgi:hypothetical protein
MYLKHLEAFRVFKATWNLCLKWKIESPFPPSSSPFVDHRVLFLVSVGQLVLLVHYFIHKGPSRNRFGLRPRRGSLEGGVHLRLFMRSRASPAAHCAHPHARIADGARARARAHRRRRTRTLIAFGSCARVRRMRMLIAGGSCAHVRCPSPAAHTHWRHVCIHVGGRGCCRIPCQACQPSVVSSCGFAESVNMRRWTPYPVRGHESRLNSLGCMWSVLALDIYAILRKIFTQHLVNF